MYLVGVALSVELRKGMYAVLQLGDRVVYSSHGVCSLVAVEQRKVDRKIADYYVLEPLEQPGARYYVPVHNQIAVSKLRPLLSVEQLNELLSSPQIKAGVWIPDENQRKNKYRELLNSGDRGALIGMIRLLYDHKASQLAAGRKFHQCDENFLKDAQRLLSSEFSLVLGIPKQEVGIYIEKKLFEE